MEKELNSMCFSRKSRKPGRAVELVGVGDDGNCYCVTDSLNVFQHPLAQGKPIFIVSIVGERRNGKSFFLNWLVRYLTARSELNNTCLKDLKPNDWLGDLSKHLNGFKWEGGEKETSTTKGIWIWSEPF